MQHTIRRLGRAELCTVKINCAANATDCKKLGLAVLAAVRAGICLRGAILRGVDLKGAILRGAVLERVDFEASNLKCVDLEGAHLRGADLRGVNLENANLRVAYLRRANLEDVDFRGADLEGADLARTDLGGADLRGANLKRAHLQGANLRFATGIIDAGERSDGYRFVAVCHDHGPMIAAGCRWFTLPEARAHWAERHLGTPLHAETRAKLDKIEMMARAQDWPVPEE